MSEKELKSWRKKEESRRAGGRARGRCERDWGEGVDARCAEKRVRTAGKVEWEKWNKFGRLVKALYQFVRSPHVVGSIPVIVNCQREM